MTFYFLTFLFGWSAKPHHQFRCQRFQGPLYWRSPIRERLVRFLLVKVPFARIISVLDLPLRPLALTPNSLSLLFSSNTGLSLRRLLTQFFPSFNITRAFLGDFVIPVCLLGLSFFFKSSYLFSLRRLSLRLPTLLFHFQASVFCALASPF